MEKYNFQNCQKIVVFSKEGDKILLCKRKGEADFDGVFSFIGGKMETTDSTILAGLKREKDEEVGENFKIKIYPTFGNNLLYTKEDGSSMILPHFYAMHEAGDIVLSDEYSEHMWVPVSELDSFEPKISTIPEVVKRLLKLRQIIDSEELVTI